MPHITDITPTNAYEESLFCIKDTKRQGFHDKYNWFSKRYKEGLRLKILKDADDKQLGFIEYIPADKAWRPVHAPGFMFIHCLMISGKADRNRGYGSSLLEACETDANARGMKGVCVMASKGPWIAGSGLFAKNGYVDVDERGRFVLLSKKWRETTDDPQLLDWTTKQKKYQGWHLLYADQCPWHEKSVFDVANAALDLGIDLQVKKISTARAARNGPSGYGVFALLHDGKLLEDHYISATRFRNIVRKEMGA